jgi:hypothetical protein
MRVTRDALLTLATSAARERAEKNVTLQCIFLCGSLMQEESLMFGTTDIDLMFVHSTQPTEPREMVRVNDEIHLDIHHLPESLFRQPRTLRKDIWIGSTLWSGPKLLYDVGHWFEFMLAGATAQFMSPENILARCSLLLREAREAWSTLSTEPPAKFAEFMAIYLDTIEKCGNAIACCGSIPLPLRRFWIGLPVVATINGVPELASRLQSLLMPEPIDDDIWQAWFKDWEGVLLSFGKESKYPPLLAPCRRKYYTSVAAGFFAESPAESIWILLRTWIIAAQNSRETSSIQKSLHTVCALLGFSPERMPIKLEALDNLLDQLDNYLDSYTSQNGL